MQRWVKKHFTLHLRSPMGRILATKLGVSSVTPANKCQKKAQLALTRVMGMVSVTE
jgi:hypothetical protein